MSPYYKSCHKNGNYEKILYIHCKNNDAVLYNGSCSRFITLRKAENVRKAFQVKTFITSVQRRGHIYFLGEWGEMGEILYLTKQLRNRQIKRTLTK